MGSAALLLGVFLVAVGPLVGQADAAPPAADTASLSGVYECRGTGADGRPYRGAVVIEPDGSRFLVQWYIAAQLTAVGLGIREGDMLAVSFFSADAGGVVLYRINGGRLVGHWSAPLSNGQIFEETLTRVGDSPASQPPGVQPPAPRPRTTPSPDAPAPGQRPITTRPSNTIEILYRP
jgi:hypothetical protein